MKFFLLIKKEIQKNRQSYMLIYGSNWGFQQKKTAEKELKSNWNRCFKKFNSKFISASSASICLNI